MNPGLIEGWTLVGRDLDLLGQKPGPTRLGFALLLKFFEIEARFPSGPEEFDPAAVAYVSEQVGVPAEGLVSYMWTGRTIERHRSDIRSVFGFREFTSADEARLAGWLAERVCPSEVRESALLDAL
ncbi:MULTISPECIES: DUF4158 domain-containing protein [unclassified Arthrobacter]|uniref:DUF4158 domain-containing protein n=1 Tax=unclassified Arthrobacter TaxID=235627 RepID=UPI00339413C1